MTVEQLIDALKMFPKDMIVTDAISEITSVGIKYEWHNVDSDDPKNDPISVVLIS